MLDTLDGIFLISLIRCSKSGKRRSLLMDELNKIGLYFDIEKSKKLNQDKAFERNANLFKSYDKLRDGIPFLWVGAVDGNNISINHNTTHIQGCSLGRDNKRKKITRGEIGCWLSHRNIWEYCKHNNLKKVLILEDDCVFNPLFRTILNNIELPKIWELLYPYHYHFYFQNQRYKEDNFIGVGEKIKDVNKEPAYYLHKTSKVWRTHAYFCNDNFDFLLENTTHIDCGIDDRLAQIQRNCYGIIPAFQDEKNNKVNFWNSRQLVGQRKAPSTIKR